uniref:Uncharacterized protein n=1 Tax=Vitis vinifera TaxID=29760 RepID=A5C7F8_VITVI|nr:hypothetical protein VITISV_024818 [Vitis vinifera]
MEARLAKVELAMADTREGLDLIEQGMEKGLEDLREKIQDLREGVGCQGVGQLRDVGYFEAIALNDEVIKVCRYGERHLHHRDVGGLQEGDQEAVYSEDMTYLAGKNMRRFNQIGLIRDYVKEFSSLMLEILNMIEELLFNFMDNLQEWAEQELRR